MNSAEIRKSFLDFFEERGHTIMPSSSLLPQDPTVLFTTAGMQQFKDYYLGKTSPYGKRAASVQKCFRTSDIEDVGDEQHLTFLEMLGNFSFNDYFKEEAIEFARELLNSECRIPNSKLWITVFKGEKEIPEDKESREIWQRLGIPKEKIYGFGKNDNFWGPTGDEGPCGPTTEIHYELRDKPCEKGKSCIPNCGCGRFVELWNLVFNEYYRDKEKKHTLLKQKGVDTGMGLERLAMVIQKKPSIFETDLFKPLIKEIEKNTSKPYSQNQRAYRIIADHIKGSVFLAGEGVLPSNIEEGYVLRRVLRRAIRFGKLLNLPKHSLVSLAKIAIELYQDIYPELQSKQTDILTIIQNEEEKFGKALEKGMKEFKKLSEKGYITGEEAFRLYETHSVLADEELTKEYGIEFRNKEGFEQAIKKHQEISRAGAEKKFGGVGISKYEVRIMKSEEEIKKITKLHTATHLFHQALREVLGKHVRQMGSNITEERLRFDFNHPQKMTFEEIKKVEDLVNQKIKEDLAVEKKEMKYDEAIKSGALAFFKEKYPEMVTVYSIDKFSREICGGPHVEKTSELSLFKIKKEESCGAGVRRIKAILE